VLLKLFERIYAPLTAGLLSPISADARLQDKKKSRLDRLYQRVIDDLDTLVRALAPRPKSRMTPAQSENKIPIASAMTG
jgi:hypothetical protein